MQICMKMERISSRKLAAALQSRRAELRISYGKIAAATDVHPSQVSRICRGEFTTITGNVMQICKRLGVDPASAELLESHEGQISTFAEEMLKRKIAECVGILWDGTPEGAERVARIFEDLADLANPGALRGFDR
jgi:transcriptional regulator with XRE-family HTH domain